MKMFEEIRKSKKKTYSFIALCVLVVVYIIAKSFTSGDFSIFLAAAETLRNHHDMYNVWLRIGSNGFKYYYSPLFALLLIPFTYLPLPFVNFLWLSANVYFLIGIWKFILSKLDISFLSSKEVNIFILLNVLLTLRFVMHNFDMIQMTIFLLWAMLQSLKMFEEGKNKRGALLLAFVINIKIMPVVMVPYLLLRKKFTPVVWILVFSVFWLYLPVLFLGRDFNDFLIVEWLKSVNPANPEHNLDGSLGGESISSWIPPLLMNIKGELPLKRNIANLDVSTVNWIMNTIKAAFILFTFYFTGVGLTFFKKVKPLKIMWELGYVFLITPLVFPHQQKYEFFLMVPAVAYISYFLVSLYHSHIQHIRRSRWVAVIVLLSISFVLNTLTSDMFIGVHLSNITQHYKTITYGTILLVVALAMCSPKYLEAQV